MISFQKSVNKGKKAHILTTEILVLRGIKMKKQICGKIYDTETATLIARRSFGSFGEEDGFEEILYKTPEGSYFLFGKGGKNSPYPEEKITRISLARAEAWKTESK